MRKYAWPEATLDGLFASLQKKTNLGDSTIQRMEAVDGVPAASARNLAAVQSVLVAAGIEFIDDNGGGPGVRLRS